MLRKSPLNMGTVPSQTIRPYRKKPPIKPKPQPDEHPAKPDHTKRNPTLNLITATRQTAIPIYPASPGQKQKRQKEIAAEANREPQTQQPMVKPT